MKTKEINLITGAGMSDGDGTDMAERHHILSHVKRLPVCIEEQAARIATEGLMAYTPVGGITAVFTLPGEESGKCGIITVGLADRLHITLVALIMAAERNEAEDITVIPMAQLIAQILYGSPVDGEELDGELLEGDEGGSMPMYVLTNTAKCHGAYAMLHTEVLAGLSGRLGTDLVIFPSSIHESIAVPVEDLDPDDAGDFCNIVREVNRQPGTLSPGEKLADWIYYYSRENGQLDMVNVG